MALYLFHVSRFAEFRKINMSIFLVRKVTLVLVDDVNSVSEKRVTSLAISGDEKFVCFADKFGVVYVVDIGDYNNENLAPVNTKGVPILSHYCSIITRLV